MNHIKSVHDDEKSWCGKILTIEFYFKSLDQAILTGLFPDAKTPCADCIHECVTLLKNITNEATK
jgi:hypothetical protein